MSTPPVPPSPATARPLAAAYAMTAFNQIAVGMVQLGSAFFAKFCLGFDTSGVLMLAIAVNVVYVVGALSAASIARRFGPRRTLLTVWLAMAAVILAPLIHFTPTAIVVGLLAFMALAGISWPPIESAIAIGADPRTMQKRIARFNLIWAGTYAVALPLSGVASEGEGHAFLIAAGVLSLICWAIAWRTHRLDDIPPQPPEEPELTAEQARDAAALAASRRVALVLSRLMMPATYACVYAMNALLATSMVLDGYSATAAAAIVSIWLVVRWGMFAYAGWSTWWHRRPSAMLVAGVVMLIAFSLNCMPPSMLGLAVPHSVDLASIVLGQVLLGLSMGLIYKASLYFGMVLGGGGTEHGGYHEALIGAGGAMGALAGLLAAKVVPGVALASPLAVLAVLVVALVIASAYAVRYRSRSPDHALREPSASRS